MRGRLVLGIMVVLLTLSACAHDDGNASPRATPNSHHGVHFTLYTHCGIDGLRYGGVYYERAQGPLSDGEGNPPKGWDNPEQDGWLSPTGTQVVFTDSGGHREQFRPRHGATGFKQTCS